MAYIPVNENASRVFVGTDLADLFEINEVDDYYTRLYGGGGNDLYLVNENLDYFFDYGEIFEAAGGGIDTIRVLGWVDSGTYYLPDNVEHLLLDAESYDGGTSLIGNALANSISTDSSYNDTIDGGAGNDIMAAGGGDDAYYADSSLDVVIEAASAGYDTVYSSASYTLAPNVEELRLQGSGNINGTGNALGNDIYGNDANNVLTGLLGDDELYAGEGNDVLQGNEGNDDLYAGEGNDVLSGGAGNDYLDGGGGNDNLDGGEGNDTLDGGGSDDDKDTLQGGGGDDEIYADETQAVSGGAGNDLLYVHVDGEGLAPNLVDGGGLGDDTLFFTNHGGLAAYTLPAALENVIVDGDAIELIGNPLANHLTGTYNNDTLRGGGGNDVLWGGEGGADSLFGGGGNDSYIVDGNDTVLETSALDGAADTVYTTSQVYLLGAFVENLVFAGDGNSFFTFHARGNELANSIMGTGDSSSINELYGMGGNDTLDALGGEGVLIGGAGNDTYVITNGDDVRVVELAGTVEGTADTVRTDESHRLGSNLEILVLTGNNTIEGIGNALGNRIEGNATVNFIDGGRGNDTMLGGKGDDTYRVDSALDVVTELTNEGTDTVLASTGYTLSSLNVENLSLLEGAGNISGTGNLSNNRIDGNSGRNVLNGLGGNDQLFGWRGKDTLNGGDGNDLLDGGTGADSMIGGLGNDTYQVNQAGDVVNETLGGGGVDLVISQLSRTLETGVDNLTLMGDAVNGFGNDLNNHIIGNSLGNSLSGGIGNDTLDGGGGNDLLDGGAGNDTYRVNQSDDFVTDSAGADTVISTSISYNMAGTAGTVVTLILEGEAYYGAGNALGNSITGTAFDNELYGNTGADTLRGGAGDDYLHGGNDSAADSMDGGAGNDDYVVSGSVDIVTESLAGAAGGTDVVYLYPGTYTSNKYVLGANVENATIEDSEGGLTGGLEGNALNNLLYGDDNSNLIKGLDGNDTLYGYGGGDTLEGGVGNDVLDGGAGNDADSLNGGLGNDLYNVYQGDVLAADSGGVDIVNLYTFTGGFNAGALGIEEVRHLQGGGGNVALTGGAVAENFRLLDTSAQYSLIGSGGNDSVEIYVSEGSLSSTDFEVHDLDGGNGVNPAGPGYIDTGFDTLLINVFSGEGDILVGNTGFDRVTVTGNGGLAIGEDFDVLSTSYVVDNYATGINSYNNVANYLYLNAGTLNEAITLTMRNGSNIQLQTQDVGALTIRSEDSGGANNTIFLNDFGDADSIKLTGDEALWVFFPASETGIEVENFNGAWLEINQAGTNGQLYLTLDNVNTELYLYDWGNVFVTVASASEIVLNADLYDSVYLTGSADLTLTVENSDAWIIAHETEAVTLYSGNLDVVINDPDGVRVYTGSGNDTLVGGSGNDYFDFQNRLDGNDRVDGGGGYDHMEADVSAFNTANPAATFDIVDIEDLVLGGAGNDLHLNAAGIRDSTIYLVGGELGGLWTITNLQVNLNAEESGMSVDVELVGEGQMVVGSGYTDIITGAEGYDYIEGGAGSDTLTGGGGGDTLSYAGSGSGVFVSLGTNSVSGGHAAGDVVSGFENAVGSAYDDLLAAGGADSDLSGGAGNDTLYGGVGGDYLSGGSGNDTLYGYESNDWLDGGWGNDYLSGGYGDDLMYGNDDNDTMFGGDGYDQLYGNNGNDELYGDFGNDSLTGDAGNDYLDGGFDNDWLDGGSDNDTMLGGSGYDTLNGGYGADSMSGGSEDDALTGFWGNNTLSGGTGYDSFNFDTNKMWYGEFDLITDFTSGGDLIRLDSYDIYYSWYYYDPYFDSGNFYSTAVSAELGTQGDYDDWIKYDTSTGNLYFDSNGSDGGGLYLLATLNGGTPAALAYYDIQSYWS